MVEAVIGEEFIYVLFCHHSWSNNEIYACIQRYVSTWPIKGSTLSKNLIFNDHIKRVIVKFRYKTGNCA